MAAVGGLSSNTSSSVNMYGTSIKGYGGLASGLDTDSLIEGMTQGTRLQITELLKKKTTNQWQTDQYRSISDKLIEFQTKYLDTSSSSSILKSSFFDKSIAEVNGTKSNCISVSGSVKNLENLKIVGVGQLAKDTNLITNSQASSQSLTTGVIDFSTTHKASNLEGTTLTFTYGTQDYTISLRSGREYTFKDADGNEKTITTDFTQIYDDAGNLKEGGLVDSINAILQNTTLSGSGKLGDKLEFSVNASGNLAFTAKNTAGNTVALKDGSEKALALLGFKADSSISESGTLTGEKAEDIDKQGQIFDFKTVWENLAGKSITFDYNGTKKQIKMPTLEEFKSWGSIDASGNVTNLSEVETKFTEMIQKQFATAFGTGRVNVSSSGTGDKFKLSFTTSDKSSVLKISSADAGLVGSSGILGVTYSSTNRLNMDAKISESGLSNSFSFGAKKDDGSYDVTANNDAEGNLKLTINGKKIEGLTVNSSLSDLIRAVNNSDAGVKMTYLETSDVFSLTSTIHGGAGTISLEDDFSKVLFGEPGTDYKLNQGQDSVMLVEYEGGVKGTITRDTNSFNFEGATISLKNTFGLDSTSNTDPSLTDEQLISAGYVKNSEGKYVLYSQTTSGEDQTLSFTTSVNSDKISEAVSSMIKDYNEIIKLVNDTVSTKPNRNYEPLSDDEKKSLSESEIKTLEDKAKEGLLFNDSLLRGLSDRLRTVFSGAANAKTLEDMGITISSSYKDNGKIYFDEDKLKAALTENSDKVKELFTRPELTDANGKITDKGGISVRLKSITYDFANIMGTKGSLIKKAGSSYSAISELDNAMLKMRNSIDDQVKKLKEKLQTQIDRYTKKFTSLETLISQMNSQSSYLSQLGG